MDQRSVGSAFRSSSRSRHNSRLRQHIPQTQFPVYHPVSASYYRPAQYCRSLIPKGRGIPQAGFPASEPPEAHFSQGLCIGDVGYIDDDGAFKYRFNIFYPQDHPIQSSSVPRNFVPVEPPLSEWKIQVTPNVEPGTIITSDGITHTRIVDQPLEIEFTTRAREGAVLILPEGLTCEDLGEPDRLYPYIKKHASDWYQFMNGYSDIPLLQPKVNSSLMVITGADKTRIWNGAQFPPNRFMLQMPTVFRYADVPEQGRLWDQSYGSFIVHSDETSGNSEGQHPCAIFFRGISVALSKAIWNHGVAPIPDNQLPVYCIPSVPVYGKRDNLQRFIQRLRRSGGYEGSRVEVVFHPAILLLQILLEVAPQADIAVVENSDWSPLMNGRSLILSEVKKLVHKILAEREIATTEGIAHFIPKGPIEANLEQKFRSYVRLFLTGTTRSKSERKALRKMKQILSRTSLTDL